jgi:hypothetical protein
MAYVFSMVYSNVSLNFVFLCVFQLLNFSFSNPTYKQQRGLSSVASKMPQVTQNLYDVNSIIINCDSV